MKSQQFTERIKPFKDLYQLVSSGDGLEQKSLALLLYDAIHVRIIPHYGAFLSASIELFLKALV